MTVTTLVNNAITNSGTTTKILYGKLNSQAGDWTYVIAWADDPGSGHPYMEFVDGTTAEIEIVMPWVASPTTPSMSMGIWRFKQLPGQEHWFAINWTPLSVAARMVMINTRNGTRQKNRLRMILNHDSPPTGDQAATAPGVQAIGGGGGLVIAVMAERVTASVTPPSSFTPPFNTAQYLGKVPSGASAFPGAFGAYSSVENGTLAANVVYTVPGSPYAGLRVGTAMGMQLFIPSIDDDPPPPPEPGYDNKVSVEHWYATDGPVPEIDDKGNVWVMQNLDGWFGGVDIRPATIDKPMADGVFDGPAPFAGRTVTVTGTIVSLTRTALQQAFDSLASVLAGAERIGILRVEERVRSITRRAVVRLGGPVLIQRTGSVTAQFSLALFAADPTRYSDSETSVTWSPFKPSGGRNYDLWYPRQYGSSGQSGYVTVSNNGNVATWPTFTITGPAINPVIRLQGGAKLQVNGSLTSGNVLVIDTEHRLVLLNDNINRSLLSSDSEWFSLPPGESTLYFAVDDMYPSAKATVTFRDAYS